MAFFSCRKFPGKIGSMASLFVSLTSAFTLTICPLSLAQTTLVDDRDNRTYPLVQINGTTWMAGNLEVDTELSYPLSPEQQSKAPALRGRYYHVSELGTICPAGWELPDTEDWLGYFEHLVGSGDSDVTLKFVGDVKHFMIDGYYPGIDLFEKDNPLNLLPTGRTEGDEFFLPDDYADYWTMDPPSYESEGKKHSGPDHVHVMPEVVPGKTHIHIRQNSFTNIHSHKHHLDPGKEKQLRRFMVRCVKIVLE